LNDLWKLNFFTCGDGSISPYKLCDPFNDICCNSYCQLKPASQPCRSSGPCGTLQYCNGTSPLCPTIGLVESGTICRNSTGLCDNIEYCTGNSSQCPLDILQPEGAICRNSTGICDMIGYCNGTSNQCPPDILQPEGTLCRNSTGPCDPAETCNGVVDYCPVNIFSPNGTQCTTDQCGSQGTCNGSSGICFIENRISSEQHSIEKKSSTTLIIAIIGIVIPFNLDFILNKI